MFSNVRIFRLMLFTVRTFELYSIIKYYFWSTIKLLDHWPPAPRMVGVFNLPPRVGFFKNLTYEIAALYKSHPRHPLHMTRECGFINNLPLEEEHTYMHLFISLKETKKPKTNPKKLVCNKIALQEHKGSSMSWKF